MELCPDWFDASWWEYEIQSIVSIQDPVICNLRITLAHYQLSLALRAVLGSDTGANFHTRAIWGSKKAGTTIRQEDLPSIRPFAALAGAGLGALGVIRLARGRPHLPVRLGGGALLAGWFLYRLTDRLLREATRRILRGNITVLEDIGRVTAAFVDQFHTRPDFEPERLEAFLGSLRPGPAEGDGQDLLKKAFRHYALARHEPETDARHEHMLLANLQIILHEHIRLQPHIQGAMPAPLRRLVTAHLLNFQVGPEELSVCEDIEAWRGLGAPVTLHKLENEDLIRFLAGPGGWDRTPNSYVSSRATNWADIRDRMNYIVDLFRCRHFDPNLFVAPHTADQCAELLRGRVPSGPL